MLIYGYLISESLDIVIKRFTRLKVFISSKNLSLMFCTDNSLIIYITGGSNFSANLDLKKIKNKDQCLKGFSEAIA